MKISMTMNPRFERTPDLREELLNMWDIVNLAKAYGAPFHKVRDMDCLINYGTTVVHCRKRRTPMDVNKMVNDWRDVIVVLATAHDKADIDRAEFRMDELLSPILAAPVADLRAFHEQLMSTLREDKRVPFFIWSTFNAWGKAVLERAEAKPERQRLRRKLAKTIADMVEEDVQPDISKAITGALMWRDPETLNAIKTDLEAGAKPKLKGRESCLFLSTRRPGRGHTEHLVML